jgi:hypothetical protein
MQPQEMSFQQYCCLKRPRFLIDPEKDAEWYFGNLRVQESIMERLRTDVDVRGVPKFGIVGRFGIGKTHNLFHLKYIFDGANSQYNFRTFYVKLSPYSEDEPTSRGWGYIYRKILDAMGERFLRELVRAADSKGSRKEELSRVLEDQLKFGDANLKESLAYVLANYFLRDVKKPGEAWAWLKGQGECPGTTKVPETSSDMTSIVLNIGHLSRLALGSAIVLLFDEAQALGEVKKGSISQIHDSFLQLAEPDNGDVGFVLAVFGTGNQVPSVIMQPSDIISRLDVTERDLHRAFIDLKDVIRTKEDLRRFADQVLANLIDQTLATSLIGEYSLKDVTPRTLPFTQDALERVAEVVFGHEDSRSPRRIIDALGKLASAAYQASKLANQYLLVSRDFAEPILRTY